MIRQSRRAIQRSGFFLSASLLGIVLYNIIPALFLDWGLIPASLLMMLLAVLGALIAGRVAPDSSPQGTLHIDVGLVWAVFLLLIGLKLYLGEISVLSFSEEVVSSYLDDVDHLAPRGPMDILKAILETYVFLVILMLADRRRLTSALLLLALGVLTVSTSRSTLAAYAATILFIVMKQKLTLKSMLAIIGGGLAIFYVASILRGDLDAIVFQNVFLTAIGYPAVNLSELHESDYRGSAAYYLLQLLIKPIPGFVFSPFGGKPIFNFNVEVTTMLTGIEISSDRPISVFTAVAPLVYYEPLVGTIFVQLLVYVLIFRFGIFLARYPTVLFNSSLTLFLMHRSNSLDFISTAIIVLLTMGLVILTHRLLAGFRHYRAGTQVEVERA